MIHNLPTCRLLVVEGIPVNDIEDFEIIRDQDNYDQKQFKYPTDTYKGLQNYGWVNLPPGNWELLGRRDEVSDETWKGIVEGYVYSGRSSYQAYKNYSGKKPESEDDILDTATASASSLIEGNPVVLIDNAKQ